MVSGRFRFGLFEFDPATRELRREGALVRLQSQPAQVLSCLIMHRGEVVSRESLREAVWGAETFVDFDRGLNFCIAQIRSALNDDTTTPRFVRTIPKRGYQFIAPIEKIPDAASPEAKATKADSGPQRSWAMAAAAACAVVFLALAFCAGYWLRRKDEAKASPIVAVMRFDNETGDASRAGFSDALTDNLVEQLTTRSGQHYEVIGNAKILRLPRDQRDLRAISETLHARYVVLGQVQGSGAQTRILAHLIRLPDQTHLWVDRMGLTGGADLELAAAQKLAADFSRLVEKDSSGSPLLPFPSK